MKNRTIIFFIGFALLAMVTPVWAGTLYLSGGPNLGGAIAGTNEFFPGEDTKITVLVENRGLIDIKIIRDDIVSRDDLPNTAKLMRVGLGTGDAPITVKTDPQMIGDLSGGSTRSVAFNVKIAEDALAGDYVIPLTLQYTYLYSAESEGQDNIHYYYKDELKVLNLSIKLQSTARLEVLQVTTEQLNVGTEGYLSLTLRNVGSEDARKGVLRISRNGNSPVIPTDSSVYVDTFPPGDTTIARFKLSVSSSAEGGQTYPIDLVLTYKDSEGTMATTETVTFGVVVEGKVDFEVISPPPQIAIGEKKVIGVEYRNTGAAKVFNAQARLSAVDPFTSGDDTAFLGDMAPGESKVAAFEVNVDSGAIAKEYGLDSEIRYRDALDNSLISDTMKVKISVSERPGILSNPVILLIIVMAALGIAFGVMRFRKRT